MMELELRPYAIGVCLALWTLVVIVVVYLALRDRRRGRTRLPSRRRSVNYTFEHLGHTWHANVNTEGPVRELFLSTAKTGELLHHMSKDAAICASIALQHGCPLDELRSSLARETGGEPLSPLARALDLAEGARN